MKKDFKKVITCRVLGESHILIGLAKSDNFFSDAEKRKILFTASKTHTIAGNKEIELGVKEQLREEIEKIFKNSKFLSWTSEEHLSFALENLNRAKEILPWSINNLYEKIELSLRAVAEIDEYVIKESKFIKKVKIELNKLMNENDEK